MKVDFGKFTPYWGCLIFWGSTLSASLNASVNFTETSHTANLFSFQNNGLMIKDTSANPRPQFSRRDTIQQKSSFYWDSVFAKAYSDSWKFKDTIGNLEFIPWKIRSRFQLQFETGWVPNSRFERFLGGNDEPFYAIKISRVTNSSDLIFQRIDSVKRNDTADSSTLADSMFYTGGVIEINSSPKNNGEIATNTSPKPLESVARSAVSTSPKTNAFPRKEDEIAVINSPKSKNEIAIKTSPKTTNHLRVLIKFDWMGKDTLRNILLLSDENDHELDLNTVLNYWVGIHQIKNVQVNRNDTFLPKKVLIDDHQDFGFDVFLPEFYITPLTCFHAPILVEFWGKNSVTVFRDMEKIDGLTLDDVIPILKSVKSHTELYHSQLCKQDMMKLQLFIKNKNVQVSEFINFVEGITELSYLLEVKTN